MTYHRDCKLWETFSLDTRTYIFALCCVYNALSGSFQSIQAISPCCTTRQPKYCQRNGQEEILFIEKKWKEFYYNVSHSPWLTRNSHLNKLSLTAKGSSPELWYIASNMTYTKTMAIQYISDSTPVATKNCASDEKSPINWKDMVLLQYKPLWLTWSSLQN